MKDYYKVVSLYCFITKKEKSILDFKNKLLSFQKFDITGLIILAEEGINGTICSNSDLIEDILKLIRTFADGRDLNEKISFSKENIFKSLKIKIKPEIVTIGLKDINPNEKSGTYLDPFEWNKLIEDKNTLVIDTRNYYEVALGSFKNAKNPKTNNFREFPDWVEKNLDNKDKRIAMFCTGGIRCEKATSLLRKKGFKNIFHLKGGILKYLENIPTNKNLYIGECYVFDSRVSVNKQLKKGSYSICHACGMPLSVEDKNRGDYIEGVQCFLCLNKFTDQDRKRFAERQKQINDKKKKY